MAMYNINVMSFNDFPNTLNCLKTFKKRSIVKMVNRTGIESSCKRVGIFKITNHMIITIQLFYCILQKNLGTSKTCLLYTSDAADERTSVDLGGRRIIKKKKKLKKVE